MFHFRVYYLRAFTRREYFNSWPTVLLLAILLFGTSKCLIIYGNLAQNSAIYHIAARIDMFALPVSLATVLIVLISYGKTSIFGTVNYLGHKYPFPLPSRDHFYR